MKHITTFLLILVSLALKAQDFEYGEANDADLSMKRYEKDTTAHAVVLREFGKAQVLSEDYWPIMFNYHVKIKIFDSKGYDNADVAVYLYNTDNNVYETVRDIKGITIYQDQNGVVQRSELDKSKIFREQIDKHHEKVTFTLPNVHDGCVIEYVYTTESPYDFNFHGWDFQSNIPKVYSEYNAHIPAVFEYNIALRGGLQLDKNDGKLEKECFSYYGLKADCSNITYVMKDIPAFKEESYMTAARNFVSAISFELSTQVDANGHKQKMTKEWKDADADLKADEDFGTQLKRKELLKGNIPQSLMANADTLQKAKGIYTFIQKWFKWDGHQYFFSPDGIKKALEAHTGNSADINLSLIDALNAAGINAEAVLLSTRDNGLVHKLFPVITEFNYVIAKVDIDNQTYLLDATDPQLPFGLLPLRCINDQGRVMSLNKPSYWIDLVQTQKQTSSSIIDLTLQPDGKIKGTATVYLLGYDAYEARKAIKKYSTTADYMENFAGQYHDLHFSKWNIEGVDSLDGPVTETFDIELRLHNGLNSSSIEFNPSFWSQLTENPFKLDERSYPVDIGSTSRENLTLTLHIPDNYDITAKPQPVGLVLPNRGGQFITYLDTDQGTIKYSQLIEFKKAIYSTVEYPYLKELYNKIIQNQKATIVLTKKP